MASKGTRRDAGMHSKSSALFRSKEELNRIAEEISDRGEMDLVLNIAISVAVLLRKMAASMPKFLMKKKKEPARMSIDAGAMRIRKREFLTL